MPSFTTPTSTFKHHIPDLLSPALHKGTCGRIGILGGSPAYTGAPYYAGISALKFGADLTYIFTAQEACVAIKSYSPELMVVPVYSQSQIDVSLDASSMVDAVTKVFPRLHGLLIGPGLGRHPCILNAVKEILQCARKTTELIVVLDADALFLLQNKESLAIVQNNPRVILTPNIVEYKRLRWTVLDVCGGHTGHTATGQHASGSPKDVEQVAKILGGVTIVLKGKHDVVSNGTVTLVCTETGGQKRSGGQGDVLAGTIVTACSWTRSSIASLPHAAVSACTVVKRAARQAFNTEFRAMTAPDVIARIGASFQSVYPSLLSHQPSPLVLPPMDSVASVVKFFNNQCGRVSTMEAFKGAAMLIGGGMTTAITVELLSQIDAASCGVWLTFWQVLGIAITASRSQLSSFDRTSRDNTKQQDATQNNKMFIPRKIPLLTHGTSAALVGVAMIASNSAIAFQIPLPLHILLKSASLPAAAAASYLSGRLTLDGPTIGAISSVTVGALVATVGGVPSASSLQRSTSTSTFIGTLLATSSVFASAALGAFQDSVFETWGKHWREALFYSHALTLPAFLIFWKQLYQIGTRWMKPNGTSLKLWVLLLSNIACVNIAMSGIYKVTNETSSLSCTIAVTVRKFLSLLLSVALFNRGSFGRLQWIGTIGVFGGSTFWTLLRGHRERRRRRRRTSVKERVAEIEKRK